MADAWAAVLDAAVEHPHLDLSYVRDTGTVQSYFDFHRAELPPTFLFSLTELRDSLSQWARYGDDGAGIALGFALHPSELPAASGKPWRTSTELVRVEYHDALWGEDKRVSPIQSLVVRVLEKYLPMFQDPTEVENCLIELVHRLNPIVKGGAYAEEREWRIITRTVADSDEVYDVKCNRFGFAPYVPLPLGNGLELVELMLGPKLPPENDWSVKWLCKKFGCEAQISRSSLAYR